MSGIVTLSSCALTDRMIVHSGYLETLAQEMAGELLENHKEPEYHI